MNIAVIFAGGTGTRMNSKDKPKQFLKMHDKPIIIHTLEKFENNENIDAIVIACIKDWIDYLSHLIEYYHMSKVKKDCPRWRNRTNVHICRLECCKRYCRWSKCHSINS